MRTPLPDRAGRESHRGGLQHRHRPCPAGPARKYRLPILGVIDAGVEPVLAHPTCQRIGIIATRGTIRSHAYQHALALRRTGLIIHARPRRCWCRWSRRTGSTTPPPRSCSRPISIRWWKGIDTLMLACTHYPAVDSGFAQTAAGGCLLIDSATTCAEHLRRELARWICSRRTDREGGLGNPSDRPLRGVRGLAALPETRSRPHPPQVLAGLVRRDSEFPCGR
jgi:hypothetical protein